MGAIEGSGRCGGRVQRVRYQGYALPWTRREHRAWRRANLSRHSVAASRLSDGHSSVDGARRDGAGQVRAAADVGPAAGDLHDGGATGDAAAAAAAAGRQVAGRDGRDIARELRAVPEHGVREPGVHQVLPGGDAAGRAGLPKHWQPAGEAQGDGGDLEPPRHPVGVRVDADAAGAPGVAGRGARAAGRVRQGAHRGAARHVRGVALLPVDGGPDRDGGGQGGRAHGEALRRRAGARRRAARAGGGAPAGTRADGELRAGGERAQEAVGEQPQPAEADREQADVPQPHEHAAGGGSAPPPPGRRQPQAPRRAAHQHQWHRRRHAQQRLTHSRLFRTSCANLNFFARIFPSERSGRLN